METIRSTSSIHRNERLLLLPGYFLLLFHGDNNSRYISVNAGCKEVNLFPFDFSLAAHVLYVAKKLKQI